MSKQEFSPYLEDTAQNENRESTKLNSEGRFGLERYEKITLATVAAGFLTVAGAMGDLLSNVEPTSSLVDRTVAENPQARNDQEALNREVEELSSEINGPIAHRSVMGIFGGVALMGAGLAYGANEGEGNDNSRRRILNGERPNLSNRSRLREVFKRGLRKLPRK